jgi:hypothetical protein
VYNLLTATSALWPNVLFAFSPVWDLEAVESFVILENYFKKLLGAVFFF